MLVLVEKSEMHFCFLKVNFEVIPHVKVVSDILQFEISQTEKLKRAAPTFPFRNLFCKTSLFGSSKKKGTGHQASTEHQFGAPESWESMGNSESWEAQRFLDRPIGATRFVGGKRVQTVNLRTLLTLHTFDSVYFLWACQLHFGNGKSLGLRFNPGRNSLHCQLQPEGGWDDGLLAKFQTLKSEMASFWWGLDETIST